jgi:hypothetical protein
VSDRRAGSPRGGKPRSTWSGHSRNTDANLKEEAENNGSTHASFERKYRQTVRSADRETISHRLGASLSEQIFGLAIVARCLLPFLPRSAAELHEKLGIPLPALYWDPLIVDGSKTAPEAVLFPRRLVA